MNDVIPQWLDLENAIVYLNNQTNEKWTIPALLELGRLGKLPMYAIVPEDSYIQYWDMADSNTSMRQQEISDFLPLTAHNIQKIQKFYPASGHSVLIEAPLPDGCSYDLPEYWPIFMRIQSKDFSRGVVIKSHEAIRILGKELEVLLTKQAKPAKPTTSVITQNALKKSHYMDSPIKQARNLAINPNDVSEIWGLLKANAQSASPWSPIGGKEERIDYIECISEKPFSKGALRKYLERNPHTK